MIRSNSETSFFKRFQESLENQLTNIYPPRDSAFIRSKCQRPRESKSQNSQQTDLQKKVLERSYESLIGPVDERRKVKKAQEWPNSVNGVVKGKFNEKSFQGTGIMIGPNVVLTAGHTLFSPSEKISADLPSLRFLPGANGEYLPFEEVQVEKYFISSNFMKEEKEDYALMILKEPIGEMTGFFGLACLKPDEFSGKMFNIFGYPSEKADSKSRKYELWGMEGLIDEIDEKQSEIHYKIHTTEGQSGSGIFFKENNEYFVSGIHAAGEAEKNTGTLLTKKIYQQIYQWIQEYVSKEFLLSVGKKRDLNFEPNTVNGECISLLLKFNLDNLSELILNQQIVGEPEVQALALNTSWANFFKLSLNFNQIGDKGVKALAKNTSWTKLSQLNLSFNNIGADGVRVLGQNVFWTNLSQLAVEGNNLGIEGVKALVDNASWSTLSHLNLSWNKINAAGARKLAENISWKNLTQLNLSGNEIGVRGATTLAQNMSWQKLSELSLGFNGIGNEGAEALAQNTSWTKLSKLDLSGNKIGFKGIKALILNTSWTTLSNLSLFSNLIGDEEASTLAQNTAWKNLSRLTLDSDYIMSEKFRKIASAKAHIEFVSYFYVTSEQTKRSELLPTSNFWTDNSASYLDINDVNS